VPDHVKMAISRLFLGVALSHDAPPRQDAPRRKRILAGFPGVDSKHGATVAGGPPCRAPGESRRADGSGA
jgi:hypothetical protein